MPLSLLSVISCCFVERWIWFVYFLALAVGRGNPLWSSLQDRRISVDLDWLWVSHVFIVTWTQCCQEPLSGSRCRPLGKVLEFGNKWCIQDGKISIRPLLPLSIWCPLVTSIVSSQRTPLCHLYLEESLAKNRLTANVECEQMCQWSSSQMFK